MSTTYPEYKYSSFPDQLDKQMEIRDPSASEIALVQQQNALISAGQKAAATELMAENPTLEEAQMNAEKLLRIHHSILALQRFFYENVLDQIFQIGEIKGNWTTDMSSVAVNDEDKLNMYDIVRYPVDGVDQYFMVVSSDVGAGELPTDSVDYIQLTIKGDKGDQGYTPVKNIDYFDGVNGLGLAPMGAWLEDISYTANSLVTYDGYLYYCLSENLGVQPGEDDTWIKIEITLQVVIGTEPPANLANGGLWMHVQDDGSILLKTRNQDGSFSMYYPATHAKYVVDSSGHNVQDVIYHHYFERDDVKVIMADNEPIQTTTATLLLDDTVVAQSVLIDNTDEDSTMTQELIVQDETGTIILYQHKDLYTIDEGAGVYIRVPLEIE